MLKHIGEIAGVEFMMVVHDRSRPALLAVRSRSALGRLAEFDVGPVHRPRTAGTAIVSKRQVRRAISGQSWNEKSLPKQTRTSVNLLRSQETAIAFCESPGLVLMKASATSPDVTVIGLLSSKYSGGIFTNARALRTFSK